MRKIFRTWPFFAFIFLLDRFFFLPGRMEGTWQYEKGFYLGDPLTFEHIDIVDNFHLKIAESTKKINSCYLLGCYFGNLYLLDKETLDYSKYVKYEDLE